MNFIAPSSVSLKLMSFIFSSERRLTASLNELLTKVWCIGIRDKIWCWLQAYLSRRLQCINGKKSNLLPVISGVPQGSILGPLLFLIFIDDLPDCASSSAMLLYADDAKCYRPFANPSDFQLLQDDLCRLFDWSLEWKLKFNILKCVLLSFTSGNTPALSSGSLYHIDNQDICKTVCHRDLGILISGDLSWSPHYDLICSRAYRMLGLLRRVFNNAICILAKKNLYTSLVRSQLSYCSIIWRPQLIKNVKFLENVQRRATKYILSDFSSDYRSRLISWNMLPLMMQFELNDSIFYIKYIKYPSGSFNILDYVSFFLWYFQICYILGRSSCFLQPKLHQHSKGTFTYQGCLVCAIICRRSISTKRSVIPKKT